MNADSIFEAMVATGDNALAQLDARALDMPDKTYLHYGEDGLKLSFAQVRDRADRIAAGLAAAGLQPGQPVSVLTRNSLLAALAMFGIWRAGGVYAPVNFNFRGLLLSYQLNDTAPFALITDPSFAPALREVAGDIALRRVVVHEPQANDHDFVADSDPAGFDGFECTTLTELMATDAPVPRIDAGPHDVANIVYTSGTTGPSKGVVQPYRWINHYTYLGRRLNDADDVIYCDLPMYHVGGAFYLVARALWKGNTVGLWDRFSPTQFWARVAECGATTCVLLDVMVPWLMGAEPRADDRANTLNKVHMQPLPATHHEVAQRFGFDIVTAGFGQTESGLGFAGVIDQFPGGQGTPAEQWRGLSKAELLQRCQADGWMVVDGSQPLARGYMGRPNPLFEVGVLDEQDNRVPPGTVGQLAFRPRFPGLILHEYFRKPETTQKALRNCWFHTGDAVRELADGSGVYSFVDRLGGFIRVRGENVSSYDVEALLATHAAVRAVAALPIPAQQGDEDDIVAFVELREGHATTVDDLREHAQRVMPRYMQPRHLRIVPALPVTPTNKVEKYKLKQAILAELGLAARR